MSAERTGTDGHARLAEPVRDPGAETETHQMSSGVAYYEGELYNVVRNGRGVPAVPLVLVGIEP